MLNVTSVERRLNRCPQGEEQVVRRLKGCPTGCCNFSNRVQVDQARAFRWFVHSASDTGRRGLDPRDTHTHTYTHTYTHTHKQTYTHLHIHTYRDIPIHPYKHTNMHTSTHPHTDKHAHIQTHRYTPPHANTRAATKLSQLACWYRTRCPARVRATKMTESLPSETHI